jgi:cytochrome c551/c552
MKNKADILKLTALVLCGGAILGGASLSGGVVKIELPPETGTFKSAPGFEMANAQCLTCHSVEYVQTQPPKPLEFWTAEVKKMREKYGAPFPAEYAEGLAYYLAKNYGTETNDRPVVFPEFNSTTGGPLTAEALARKYGCLSCHNPNVKVVGPAFKDVAAKYRNDPAALDKIAQQIHHGGSGKWGSAVMPPYNNTIVSDAQAQMLGHWIMSQTGGSAPQGKPAANGPRPGSEFE